MMSLQSRQILTILSIIINSFLFSQECTELNPSDYGNCDTPLGYIWYNDNCLYINGCDMGNDSESFYSTYEECSLTSFNNASLGDVNDDSQINVIDVVQLVNLILYNSVYSESADMNFDESMPIEFCNFEAYFSMAHPSIKVNFIFLKIALKKM